MARTYRLGTVRRLERVSVVRPFFDVSPGSSLEELAREAPRHPVFRLS